MSAVSLRDVRFAYGEDFSLHLPAWEVADGDQVVVVGPSGCGKSTLLGLVSGELVPASGSVQVLGTPLHDLSDAARRAFRVQHIGWVFQDYPLVGYLDVRDNVLLPYRLHGALRLGPDVRARADRLLAELGLEGKERRRPDALSQGERQRVALARALVTEPAILLADEPTTGLDAATTGKVMAMLSEAARVRKMTLLMVTHDVSLRPHFDQMLDLGAPG